VELTGEFIGSGPIVQVRQQQNEVQVLADTIPAWIFRPAGRARHAERLGLGILTAALQDYGRALVSGTQDPRQGTVQTMLPRPPARKSSVRSS